AAQPLRQSETTRQRDRRTLLLEAREHTVVVHVGDGESKGGVLAAGAECDAGIVHPARLEEVPHVVRVREERCRLIAIKRLDDELSVHARAPALVRGRLELTARALAIHVLV